MKSYKFIFIASVSIFILLSIVDFIPIGGEIKQAIPLIFLSMAASLLHFDRRFVAALFFSAAGDLAGAVDNFVMQMISFSVAHIFYISFLLMNIKIHGAQSSWSKYLGYPLALIFLMLSLFKIVPNVGFLPITIGVVIYSLLIITMFVAAHYQQKRYWIVGALLFVISDSILAWNKFVEPLPAITYLIMVPYYGAQLSLFVSAYLQYRKQTVK
jgi:uncharacterized membrane protein YhhN